MIVTGSDVRRSPATPELLSHELRTPLTVLRGGVDLLSRCRLDEAMRDDVLLGMRRAVERLGAAVEVVEDVVTAEATSAGRRGVEADLRPARRGDDRPRREGP